LRTSSTTSYIIGDIFTYCYGNKTLVKVIEKEEHWETVYKNKNPNEVSWTQDIPQTSLDFIQSFGLTKDAEIIDIGGGDSKLVDHLLALGYINITVLDISAKSLEKAKERLGEKAKKVTWIVSDINIFEPKTIYDIWHDRAAFHFLTEPSQIERYVKTAKASVTGFLTIGTFSHNGPKKCSGLEIAQYNETQLIDAFSNGFDKIKCLSEDHTTPFNTTQNFIFCSFKTK
jgi:SAM-dependent methyltransferase